MDFYEKYTKYVSPWYILQNKGIIALCCVQWHNILMDEHNEYLLQVYGGVFEVLVRKFYLKLELSLLICLYFSEFRLDTAKITKHGIKHWVGDINSLSFCLLYFDLYVIGDDTSISQKSFMLNKQLCVLIHIRTSGEVGPFNMSKPSRFFFADRSKGVFLLWIIFVIHV